MSMIVLGADTHKRSHTIAAVSAATGELLGEKTVPVGARGFAALLAWAGGLQHERVWALEDCRHVSGSLERFLVERGERVVRVATKLMADARRGARGRGKSDRIDALAVARAALREGLEELPAAQLNGPELDLRLLVDHRERLVRQRVVLNNTLQWHLHDLWPELELPGSSLFYGNWGPAPAATRKPANTSTANAPKARPPRKPSAASNATSRVASGTSSKPPHPTQHNPTPSNS
jgi:transposase